MIVIKHVSLFTLLIFAVSGGPLATAGNAPGSIGSFTKTLSGYVGSKKKCDNTGGDAQSCCGLGSPQSYATKDGTANGKVVMLAVGSSMRKYMGCKVSIPGMGDNYRIMDFCPICDKKNRIDVSFSDTACSAANNFKKSNISGIKIMTDGCAPKTRATKKASHKSKKRRSRR